MTILSPKTIQIAPHWNYKWDHKKLNKYCICSQGRLCLPESLPRLPLPPSRPTRTATPRISPRRNCSPWIWSWPSKNRPRNKRQGKVFQNLMRKSPIRTRKSVLYMLMFLTISSSSPSNNRNLKSTRVIFTVDSLLHGTINDLNLFITVFLSLKYIDNIDIDDNSKISNYI